MGQMILSPDMADVFVKSTCVVHNFLTQRGDSAVARVKHYFTTKAGWVSSQEKSA